MRPVGFLSHRGKDYSANLHMPADVLPLILQMLTTGKYRFVAFEAAKSFRGEAAIFKAPISLAWISTARKEPNILALLDQA